jgi:hypothetical protein
VGALATPVPKQLRSIRPDRAQELARPMIDEVGS